LGKTYLHHWQVKSAEIRSLIPQKMTLDGELIEDSPAHIKLLPQAVRVLVPQPVP
jgi:diacylglycerol kinase family enzyme